MTTTIASKSFHSEGKARRSRMLRSPNGKRIALTPRDVAIFKALANYRYLNSSYLHGFVGGKSEKRFKERLGGLFHEGYLDRPDKQWEFASARCEPTVYGLGKHAERILDGEGETPEPRTYQSNSAHRQFAHTQLVCNCLASIELTACSTPHLRFIPWCEILARGPSATRAAATPFRISLRDGSLIPDGLFGLEYGNEGNKRYRFFALEVDRGTMPIARSDRSQSSYVTKLEGYRRVIKCGLHKSHWGISTLLVLTVATSQARVRNIVESMPEDHEPQFLFKAVVPSGLTSPLDNLLSAPWQRAGLSALPIDV